MATYIWCEIVCSQCSDTIAGRHTSSSIPRRAMKKEANKAGWIFQGNESFCAKLCQDNYNEFTSNHVKDKA